MSNLEKIEILQKRLLFLNTCLAGSMQTGDFSEIARYRIEIEQVEIELKELIKQEEDADR